MVDYVYIKARAKINLAIDVLSKRDDGYHELDMIMNSINLYDGILIKRVFKKNYSIKLATDALALHTDERNLAYAAAEYMLKNYGLSDGIFINLQKKIPIAAGLGGGSADCAAVLVGINKLFELNIPNEELEKIGLSFGADVPFCIRQGCQRAQGIGDILNPVAVSGDAFILIARPPVFVSTESIFKKIDSAVNVPKPDIEKLIFILENQGLQAAAPEMKNALEAVTVQKYPIIEEIKNFMLSKGAFVSLMSGSGSAVFGMFDSIERAKSAKDSFRKKYPFFKEIFITGLRKPS